MSFRITDVVGSLAAARRAVQLYPPSHPAFDEALRALERSVVETSEGAPFMLNLHQGRLYHGSAVIPADANGAEAVAEMFESRAIESLTFQPTFSALDASLDIERELLARNASAVAVSFLVAPDSDEKEERDRTREADRALYQMILGSLRTLFLRTASREGADVAKANALVGGVLERMMADPSAILGLATMRGVEERTLFHSLNVMIYTLALGSHLGLPEEGLTALGTAALLHDVGKSAYDATDPAQSELLRLQHPEVGADILKRAALEDPAPMLVAYEHHMHADGGGFPERPADYIAHPYSRMVAVADRYENLVNESSDRDALTPDRAIIQILREAGSVLDPFFSRLFSSAMGVFPVGCLVRISDQSVGVVVRPGADPLAPVIRLSYDARGEELAEQTEIDLSLSELGIVEVIEPESLNLEVAEKL